jgi:hypothetical protein
VTAADVELMELMELMEVVDEVKVVEVDVVNADEDVVMKSTAD